MPFGSQVLTINSVTYVANNVNVKNTSTQITRKDQYSIPSAEVLLVMPFTGDAELQLATWDTATPAIGQFFPVAAPGGVTLHAKVTGCSDKYQAGSETMCSIEFNKQLSYVAN